MSLSPLLGAKPKPIVSPLVWDIIFAVRRGGQSSTRVSALGARGRRGLSSEGSQVLKCSHYHRAWSLYRALNPRGGVTEDRSHASRVTEDRGGRIFKMRCLQSQAIVTPAASRALSWGGTMRRHGKTIPQFHAMKPRKQRCARATEPAVDANHSMCPQESGAPRTTRGPPLTSEPRVSLLQAMLVYKGT